MRAAILGFAVFLAAVSLITADAEKIDKRTKQTAHGGTAEDFLVVDCLLPGTVRRLGRRQTYVTPRRAVRTTALDCRIRGGEYTESDQASYATALQTWLDQAKGGDPEAQYYVAQIYEQGLGLAPDYSTAAHWYRQAAEQDYSPAQIGLGYLYEKGLGVKQDSAAALDWYRRSSGLPEELIVLEGADYEELLRLQGDLAGRDEELERLKKELRVLQQQLDEARRDEQEGSRRQEQLENQVEALESTLETETLAVSRTRTRLSELEQELAAVQKAEQEASLITVEKAVSNLELDFGPYHALVIGNRSYRNLEPIEDAVEHADHVAKLMEEKYGFTVQRLYDGTRYDILSALNELRTELTENHNLLVYYVGHSTLDRETQRTWWQPVDAETDSRANWIRTRELSSLLDLIPAKHLLVVADASYAGVLTRSSVPRLPQGMSDDKRRSYIEGMLGKKARLVMSAGGEGLPRPSVFSHTWLEVLAQGDEIVEASAVYLRVCELISERARGAGVPQVPEYAPIRWVRSDGGADFFFVPRS